MNEVRKLVNVKTTTFMNMSRFSLADSWVSLCQIIGDRLSFSDWDGESTTQKYLKCLWTPRRGASLTPCVTTLHKKWYASGAFEYSWPNPTAVCTAALISCSRGELNPNKEPERAVLKRGNPRERIKKWENLWRARANTLWIWKKESAGCHNWNSLIYISNFI